MIERMPLKATILITAGGTREHIDPVRYISNSSSGEMGLAMVRAALNKGFKVKLIKTFPVERDLPEDVEVTDVVSASEMAQAVFSQEKDADCLIMAAAVADLMPEKFHAGKIKKKEKLTLNLVKTTDILSECGKKKELVKVGFALETELLEENALKKLKRKKLDLIVANEISHKNDPFGRGEKDFLILSASGKKRSLNRSTKTRLAAEVMDMVEQTLKERGKCVF